MQKSTKIVAQALLLVAALVTLPSEAPAYPEWKYNFGAGSLGTNPAKNLRLAKAVGYEHVYHGASYDSSNYNNFKKDFFFFYNDVHKQIQPRLLRPNGQPLNLNQWQKDQMEAAAPYTLSAYPQIPRAIDESEMAALLNHSNRNIRWVGECYKYTFERTKVWANTTLAFPNNLAILQRWGTSDRFEPCPNVQDQWVIDQMVDAIVSHIKDVSEIPSQNYLCKGITFDVPLIWNEFNWASNRPAPGAPYSERYCKRTGVERNYTYQTIREGWYQFLAQLRNKMESPEGFGREIKILFDPGTMIGNPIVEDWHTLMESAIADNSTYNSINASVASKAEPDAISTETRSLYHLLDDTLKNKYDISSLSCSTMDHLADYNLTLHIMGNSARLGSSLIYYLGYDRTPGVNANEADFFPNELKLVKFASSWDNYREVPLSDRFWNKDLDGDGQPFDPVYASTHTYADKDIIYSINPKNNKLYVSFLNSNGQLRLKNRSTVTINTVERTNSFWEEDGNGINDVTIRRWKWEQNIIPSGVSEFPASYIVKLNHTNDVLIPRTKNYDESEITWEELENIDFAPFNYIANYDANWARASESIAFWRMNGNGDDHSPADNHLFTYNGAAFTNPTDGVYGRSLRLDGNDDYARCSGNVDLGDQFTIAAWIKIDSDSNNRATILANREGPGATSGFRISVNTFNTNDRTLDFQCGDGTNFIRLATTPGAIPDDTWTHVTVAVNRAAGTAALYINARIAASGGTFGQVLTGFENNAPIYIGREASSHFKGEIDDVRIYPGKLADNNEIGHLMLNP